MMLLTVFLIACGLPLLWCAIKDYDWLYKVHGPPKLLYALIDRPAARWFYVFIGGTMAVWGVFRVINPPPEIRPAFIFELAKPLGINPADVASATKALSTDSSGTIRDFRKNDDGWTSFWIPLKATNPHYEAALMSSRAGPDFAEGFNLKQMKTPSGRFIGGRLLYFDAALKSCDNMLFSKTPLSSAVFMMIICDPQISTKNGVGSDDLAVYFYRKGTADYDFIDK